MLNILTLIKQNENAVSSPQLKQETVNAVHTRSLQRVGDAVSETLTALSFRPPP